MAKMVFFVFSISVRSLMRSFSQISLIRFPIKDLNAPNCGLKNPPLTRFLSQLRPKRERKRRELRAQAWACDDQLVENFTM